MVLAWTGYYLASNRTVGYTGSAFVAGLVLLGAVIILLRGKLNKKHLSKHCKKEENQD